jgi:hypothetical protein
MLLAAAGQAAVVSSVSLGYRQEPGVESKMLVAAQTSIVPAAFLSVDAGLSLNLFQNCGFGAAALGVDVVAYKPVDLTIRFALQHQQWNDWRAGENRVLAAVEAESLHRFDAGIGIVGRAPVFGDRYWSPFVWSGGAAEWNFLYRFRWKFLQRETWWLRVGFSSYDMYTAHNPQQFPLETDGAWRLNQDVELVARVGTAMVGYSGGLVSFHEVELSAGVRYAF